MTIRGLIVVAGRIITALSAIATTTILAKYSTTESLAQYSVSLTIVIFITIIGQGGMSQSITREIAKSIDDKSRSKIASQGLFLVLLVSTIILFFSLLLRITTEYYLPSNSQALNTTPWTFVWLMLFSVQTYLAEVLRARHKIELATIVGGAAPNALSLCLLTLKLRYFGQPTAEDAILFNCISYLASLAISFSFLIRYSYISCPKRGEILPATDWKKRGTQNAIISLSSSLTLQATSLIVANTGSTKEIADFAIASRITAAISLIPQLLSQIYSPTIASTSVGRNPVELQNLASKLAVKNISLTFPAVTILLIFSDSILSTVFGDKYTSATPLLQLCLVALAINSVTGLRGPFFINCGEERILTRISVAAGIATVTSTYLITVSFGIYWGVLASSIALAATSVVEYLILRRTTGIRSLPNLHFRA